MENPIIVALDNLDGVESLDGLDSLISSLAPHVGKFKVGLEMMTRFGGPQAVEYIHARGGRVMYDGKFDDIGNTIEQATKAVASMGVDMFTIHASSKDAMKKAAAVKGKSKMLAVTVLTSLTAESLFDMGHLLPLILLGIHPETIRRGMSKLLNEYVPNLVREKATAAAQCGTDGVVCSPLELEILKSTRETRGLFKVIPAVRPGWAPANDQKRVATPAEAMQAGASYIVIGRPITGTCSPVQAAQKILAEITEAAERSEAVTEEIKQ